ncbi:hypothetical protein BsWGS_06097 [Bradybaena similaris]
MFTMERWSLLPDEIILMIFKYLADPELVNASMTCKQWRRVYYDPSLWRSRTFEFRGYCKSHAERLQTLKKYVDTVGIYLQHIQIVCPFPNLLTAYDVAGCVETLLSGLSCTQFGRSTIQSFEMCQLYFEHTWSFFPSSKWLLVDSISTFLELQTQVKTLSLRYAFLPLPFAFRIMKSFARSQSVETLKVLDVRNYFSSEVHPNLIGRQLQSVCKRCWKLQEIRLNYSYLSSAKVVDLCEYLSESLKNLSIYVTPSEYSRDWKIINSDSWRLAVQVCPRLQVYFHFEGWPKDALVFLVPYMPLVALTSSGTPCRYSTLTLGDKTSLLLNHVAERFSATVQSATFLTDTPSFTPASRDSLVNFLTKCQHIKSLVFSKQLMTQEIINQAQSELPNNSSKDLSVVKLV